MKRIVFFCLIGLLALSLNAQTDAKQVKTATDQDRKAELKLQGYVDLGLPSGTLWKDQNEESGFLTYNLAVSQYGDNLPTKEQMEELRNSCEWTWNGKGYKVVGPSGEFIVLPALGYLDCNRESRGMGLDPNATGDYMFTGSYWSSSKSGVDLDGASRACVLFFNSNKINVGAFDFCNWMSVRLVKSK